MRLRKEAEISTRGRYTISSTPTVRTGSILCPTSLFASRHVARDAQLLPHALITVVTIPSLRCPFVVSCSFRAASLWLLSVVYLHYGHPHSTDDTRLLSQVDVFA